jgi:hypothetical protein
MQSSSSSIAQIPRFQEQVYTNATESSEVEKRYQKEIEQLLESIPQRPEDIAKAYYAEMRELEREEEESLKKREEKDMASFRMAAFSAAGKSKQQSKLAIVGKRDRTDEISKPNVLIIKKKKADTDKVISPQNETGSHQVSAASRDKATPAEQTILSLVDYSDDDDDDCGDDDVA